MERYLHKLHLQSWEEKQFVDSNDTQAKEKSQCADSKILLQLWWRQLYCTGWWWALCLCTEHLLFSVLHLVPGLGSAGCSGFTSWNHQSQRIEAMRRMWCAVPGKVQPRQVLSRLCPQGTPPSENSKWQETEVEYGQIELPKAGYMLGFQPGNHGGE